MKVIISYPPLNNQKGCPTLGQNRQFQYFKEPTFIYPVIPALAATMLKQAGHEVIWNDCIAEGWGRDRFLDFLKSEKPDLIAFETKTPVIKQIWKVIDEIKSKGQSPAGTVPLILLFGDHVTALPEESFQNSKVDFVLTGGDYDFLLLNLCSVIARERSDRSNLKNGIASPPSEARNDLGMANLEPGIYYREDGQVKNTGKFKLDHDLNSAPFIDRELTKWKFYAYKNGNYKRTPGAYIMSGRDCWWAKCSFCSWTQMYPEFRVRKADFVLDEVDQLIGDQGVREIMDDTGCFSAGYWLKDFCHGLIDRGINKKIYFDCNMRFGALEREEFELMKRANFRLLLFGLESANQTTLNRINKNLKVERIIDDCKAARRAGLFPHITIMFGYPWESYSEALNTLNLGKWLLKKGLAFTMQATLVVPYPGTPLFEECKKSGALRTLDWDDYDMKAPVMKTEISDEKISELIQGMYKVSFQPEFLLRKIASIKDFGDLCYYGRASKKVLGHIFDFKKNAGGS